MIRYDHTKETFIDPCMVEAKRPVMLKVCSFGKSKEQVVEITKPVEYVANGVTTSTM